MRRWTTVIVTTTLALACGWAWAETASPLEQLNSELVQLAAKVSPNVVEILVEPQVPANARVNVWSGAPGGGIQVFGNGVTVASFGPVRGSGVILSSDGLILTSAEHLRGQPDAKIRVTLADGRVLDGKLVGSDARSGLAVIKVDAQNLPAVTLADATPPVGSLVVALGNTAGVGKSLSLGMVSAANRAVTAPASIGSATLYPNLLQITNPVTSSDIGGLVADVKGRMVGLLHSSMTGRPVIAQPVTTVPNAVLPPGAPMNPAPGAAPNVRIFDLRAGGQAQVSNVSFAVPVETIRFVCDALKKGEKVPWGYLGLYFRAEKDKGVVVVDVTPQSPAAEAGVEKGDAIASMKLAGREKMNFTGDAKDSAALSQAVGSAGAGTEATLSIVRDGKPREIVLKLGTAPEMAEQRPFVMEAPKAGQWLDQAPPFMKRPWIGVELKDTPAGAKVEGVVQGSPAERHGLRAGDVITKVGDAAVKTAEEVQKEIEKLTPGKPVSLTLKRGDETLAVEVTPGLQSGVAAPNNMFPWQGPQIQTLLGRQPWLGIEGKDMDAGLTVTRVFGGSPADEAGVKLNDVIVKVDGKDVKGLNALRDTVRGHKPGDEITVTLRRDGKAMDIQVKLGSVLDRGEAPQP